MKATEEISRNAPSVLVTGKSCAGNMYRYNPNRRNSGGFTTPAAFLQEEEYDALVELNLPTAVQVINNDAPSRLVIGRSTAIPSSRDSVQQFIPSTIEGLCENIATRLQNIHEQLKHIIHV